MSIVPANAAKGTGRGPSTALPIVSTPFERVGTEILSILPNAAKGHTHILVLVEYATHYAQRQQPYVASTTALVVAQELSISFSRLGFPHQILTDQGM